MKRLWVLWAVAAVLLASCAPSEEVATPPTHCHHYLIWEEANAEVLALLDRHGKYPDYWPHTAVAAWHHLTGRQMAAWDSFTAEVPADWTFDSLAETCG